MKYMQEKQLKPSFSRILKLIWMIVSVAIIFYLIALFFPEKTIDDWNRKFSEHLPFKRGIAGSVSAIVAAFLITLFCIGGLATYWEKSKTKN